jgi:hypothetical protein
VVTFLQKWYGNTSCLAPPSHFYKSHTFSIPHENYLEICIVSLKENNNLAICALIHFNVMSNFIFNFLNLNLT